jgi:hypothetical protein
MLASLILAAALPQGASAGPLISKMFAYYNDATSMSGKIRFTQAFQNRQSVIDTVFQFENPAKIYINQVLQAPYGSRRWLVTGDGVGFSYDPPAVVGDGRAGNRLYEPVQYIPPPPRKKTDPVIQAPPAMTVRTIYAAVSKSVGDRNLPLDVAFGRKEDLQFIKGQIVGATLGDDQEVSGVKCHFISGSWRDYDGASVNGSFQLWIADDGQLKRFARQENVAFDNNGQQVSGTVQSLWEVNITKNGGVDPQLFKVVLH